MAGELCESRDKVNIPLESPSDAGDSAEHFRSLELGDKRYLEHFKSDAGSTAGFQPGVDRVRLWVGGERERSSAVPFDIFDFNSAHSGFKRM